MDRIYRKHPNPFGAPVAYEILSWEMWLQCVTNKPRMLISVYSQLSDELSIDGRKEGLQEKEGVQENEGVQEKEGMQEKKGNR